MSLVKGQIWKRWRQGGLLSGDGLGCGDVVGRGRFTGRAVWGGTGSLGVLVHDVGLEWWVRAERIELSFSAWKADVLPLNYARRALVVYFIIYGCCVWGIYTGIT